MQTNKHLLIMNALHMAGAFSMAVVVTTIIVSVHGVPSFAQRNNDPKPVEIHGEIAYAIAPVKKGTARPTAVADRLSERLHGAAGVSPSNAALTQALETRQEYMKRGFMLDIFNYDGTFLASHYLSPGTYPQWLLLDIEGKKAATYIRQEEVRTTLVGLLSEYISVPGDCVIQGVELRPEDGEGYDKLDTGDCIVKDGITFDVDALINDAIRALDKGNGTVSVHLEYVKGQLINKTNYALPDMQLLATGRSNFEGSVWGREQNIHFAIEEHLNNLVVPAGEVFAFNSTLGGPVTLSRGWKNALGIFAGGELRPTPGGGICQTSTTMYRAMLNAGLPTIERANHSLFVHYYEEHGVGLDATIFPGSRDMRMENDTGNPLFIQAYIEGDDVTINIYGVPDGRTVTLEGPYLAKNAPDHIKVNGRDLRNNEIVWIRRITYADGRTVEEQIDSRFKSIPYSVQNRWSAEEIVTDETQVNVVLENGKDAIES